MSILPTKPDAVLHFGCIGSAGHYPSHPTGKGLKHEWRNWMNGMDGMLHDEDSDRWLTHHFEAADGSHFTFIARRDNSIDKRPGSWCGFMVPDKVALVDALVAARNAWPKLKVWET